MATGESDEEKPIGKTAVKDLWIAGDDDPLADPPETPGTARGEKSQWQKRAPAKNRFARILHAKAILLARQNISNTAWVILIAVDRLIIESGGYNPVELTNCYLREYTISPMRKWRALQELERTGTITVERRGGQRGGQSPLVTFLWLPRRKRKPTPRRGNYRLPGPESLCLYVSLMSLGCLYMSHVIDRGNSDRDA